MGATMGKSGSNILDALPSQGTFHVVMLGLDSAGKTTALYRLKFDQYLNTVPTIGFNCEKVQGTYGKAKGVQFLVWDVGGQEKLRPLWRSYTRCTDGILFVVDSVDVERMEEAKMELMRTAKCPDNQGVPVLILANKQDLPGARDSKELEKLLGLHELIQPSISLAAMSTSSSSTGNIVGCTSNAVNSSTTSSSSYRRSLTPTTQHNKSFSSSSVAINSCSLTKDYSHQTYKTISTNSTLQTHITSLNDSKVEVDLCQENQFDESNELKTQTASAVTTPTTGVIKELDITTAHKVNAINFKGWYIQPACAITGEGLQEGLEALYDMITKRRKLNKANKRKRFVQLLKFLLTLRTYLLLPMESTTEKEMQIQTTSKKTSVEATSLIVEQSSLTCKQQNVEMSVSKSANALEMSGEAVEQIADLPNTLSNKMSLMKLNQPQQLTTDDNLFSSSTSSSLSTVSSVTKKSVAASVSSSKISTSTKKEEMVSSSSVLASSKSVERVTQSVSELIEKN